MSYITAIDTLQFSNRMQKSGLNKKISDELAEAIKDVQIQSFENIATKQDLEDFTKETKQEIKEVKQDIDSFKKEIRQDFADLKRDVSDFRKEVKQDMDSFKTEIKQDIEDFKRDVFDFRKETKHEIAELRKESKQDILDLSNKTEHYSSLFAKEMQMIEGRIIIKLGGLIAVGITILVALMKL